MSTERERIIDLRRSEPGQPLSPEVKAAIRARLPTPADQVYAPSETPEVVATEEEMQRWIIDGLAGRRTVPTDPAKAALAKRIWHDLDTMPGIVDVPPSLA